MVEQTVFAATDSRRVSAGSRLAVLVLGLSLSACGEKLYMDHESTEEETDIPSIISDIDATIAAAVKTVVTVRYSTDIPARGYVAFGVTEDLDWQTPIESAPATDHSQVLVGFPPHTTGYYQVIVEADDRVWKSPIRSIKTRGLSTELPPLSLKGDGHEGFIMVPLIGGTTAVTIIDGQGRFVWCHVEDRDLDTFRVRLSQDGKGLIYNAATVSGDPSEASELVRISFDGVDKETIPIPLLAHDFVEHRNGTVAAIVSEVRDFEGEPLRGEMILERAPDGTETVIWSTWDCFDPAVDQGEAMGDHWTLANALDYDPNEEAYYIGMRNLSSIAKVKRIGGGCEWVLGSTGETLSFARGTPPFLNQHQFHVLEESILVFDNNGSPGMVSRVVEYALDLEAKEATEIWRYDPGDIYTFVLGEPIRLDNGDTFVNWSAAGQMERVTPGGKSVWQINTPAGYIFGFNTLSTSLYLN